MTTGPPTAAEPGPRSTGRPWPFWARFVQLIVGLLVYGLSEAQTYGWVTPIRGLTLGGHDVWPASRPVSVVFIAFAVSLAFASVK